MFIGCFNNFLQQIAFLYIAHFLLVFGSLTFKLLLILKEVPTKMAGFE